MPRLIDKLDIAAGRTPEVLEDTVDYLDQRSSPPALVGPDGRYNGGWYDGFHGVFNFDETSAFDLALQRWFHLSIEAGDLYIVANLADLGKATNTALLVCDKRSGDIRQVSLTGLGPQGDLRTSEDLRLFRDVDRHSFISVDRQDQRFAFSIHAEDLHLSGTAWHAIGPPLVQITRFHRGRGSLQWYGNFVVDHATLTIDEQVVPLPRNCLGSYDRTVGHQRGIQNWNWIAFAGLATDVATGAQVELGVQVAIDQPGARPVVYSKKHIVWLDGRVHKVPTARFEYEIKDPVARTTGPWRIVSDPDQEDRFDLTFHPRFQRKESRRAVVVRAEFLQYYGPVSGTVHVAGRTLRIDDIFAVCEDSLLEL